MDTDGSRQLGARNITANLLDTLRALATIRGHAEVYQTPAGEYRMTGPDCLTGFQRLYEMQRLQDSVEFAACLPWFAELFDLQEVTEARTRLITHEFPLDARLASMAASPPEWVSDL
jgi:ABC-type Na+ transport system ATPase subunit NatA